MYNRCMIIAVDTGGTKTLVASFNEDNTPKQVIKFPTPKSVDQYIQRVTDQIHLITNNQPIDVISIALPGVINEGIAVWCQNLGWKNQPIRQLFSRKFPNAKIIIANDANMAGLASMHRLPTIPRCGLYITLGTGVGTSLILNGSLDKSLNDCEGGHMMLHYNGKTTTWEEIAAGRILRELFGELSEETSSEIWENIADRIKTGLQPLIAFTQPDVVVIGGSIGSFVPYFSNILSGLLAESLPAAISVPKIMSAPSPEEIVLYGCYDNAISKLKQN